jgi:hypothetical protein
MPLSVRYQFTQLLPVSANQAFDWCTEFGPEDNTVMAVANAQRQITNIADGALIIKDVFHTPAGTIEKQKLVQLYPDIYTWTSTHLAGPNKHSQFLYQIAPQSKDACILTFKAHHLEYDKEADAGFLAEKLCKDDSNTWKLLAKAIEKEFKIKKGKES